MDRVQLTLFVAAGVSVVGALLVWGVDVSGSDRDRIAAATARASKTVAVSGGSAAASYVDVSALASRPIFALTTGPGAVKETVLLVSGVAISPVHKAALVSIDGKPADWLNVGESRETVRLVDVGVNGATFDTLLGARTVEVTGGGAAPKPAGAPAQPGAPL